jgi:hypothetical protein
MKATKWTLAALAVLAASGAAVAQTSLTPIGPNPTLSASLPLSGEVAKNCIVSVNPNNVNLQQLDLEITTRQNGSMLRLECNYSGSASVSFSSANGGKLVSGGNELPYLFYLGNNAQSAGALTAGASLASPQVFNAFNTELSGSVGTAPAGPFTTRAMGIALASAATIAGTYTDVITASVTPN